MRALRRETGAGVGSGSGVGSGVGTGVGSGKTTLTGSGALATTGSGGLGASTFFTGAGVSVFLGASNPLGFFAVEDLR
jgi:hypothetical protein